ncbi:MAG: mechanosensitive ion channel family protein, partial [Pseudomonadales bacterium]|nr:mechanosensitive ion channel family protein [Pseudomonadales bacterium]
MLNSVIDIFKLFLPLIVTSISVGIVLWLAHWRLIRNPGSYGKKSQFSNQLIMLGLTLVSIIAIALTLPVADSVRNQVVALIGLAISGVLAFSSSTIFANLMAGIMLRVTNPFHTGDFIQVADYFGRVSERGLLDTEIQSEQRELVAIPNTFLITNPVSVVRSSGTVVSANLSLGYDIHHAKIESLLKQAAENAGLEEPFVQLTELGDYAVTYKINGMLAEVKSLLTARSNLRREVLDVLHEGGVEIVSPSFMNQR